MAYFYKTSFFCLIILCLANIGHGFPYNSTVKGETRSENGTDKSREYSTTGNKENDCENGNCSSTQTPEVKTSSTDETRNSTPGETGKKPKADKYKEGEKSKSTGSSGSQKNSPARQGAAGCEGGHCSQPPSTAVDTPEKAKTPRSNSSGRNTVAYVCLLACIWIVHLLV